MTSRKAVTGNAVTVRREQWHVHAKQMASRLTAEGHIRDPRWHDAFADTARHLLVPGPDTMDVTGDRMPSWWLEAVYADDQYDDGEGLADGRSIAAPSQLTPAVLAWLLDQLIPAGRDTRSDGQPVRVLEVGAGRGYTTALLCHRMGAEHVTATDPHAADDMRCLLASLDLFPCVVSAQGVRGASAYGPFDAILCATTRTTNPITEWLAQLATGGRTVAAVRGPDGRVAANIYERTEPGVVRRRTVTRPDADAGTGAS